MAFDPAFDPGLAHEVPKMTLVNAVTLGTLEVQYNPAELEEALGVNFQRQTILGQSHQQMQYVNTENEKFTFDLFNCATDAGPVGYEKMLSDRKFLLAACHPVGAAGTLEKAGTPRLVFIWPGLLSLTCYLTSLKFKYTQFNKLSQPTAWVASVGLEEVRDVRVSMEDILAQGTQRAEGIGS